MVHWVNMSSAESIRSRFELLRGVMDERVRRLWAASEARDLGWGGASVVSQAIGMSRVTIASGLRELKEAGKAPPEGEEGEQERAARIRRPGGGRKSLTVGDATLVPDLESLVDPSTRGDPESPLRWTSKSVSKLAVELSGKGHSVSEHTVRRLLHELDYSLQANAKTREGKQHPDRNAQFEYIAERTRVFQNNGQPVISVDTKKKELVGQHKNAGREWQPKGKPETVLTHDFPDEKVGKAIPYGVYDIRTNQGWVNVGNDHDTAEFAVESIRRWWKKMGGKCYPEAQELLIVADAGGSNGHRPRLWKLCLQQLATETGLQLSVCHFPPGTSKWNKIEHRMFCHITQNWRGRPLVSHEIVVKLIGATTTKKGLSIEADLDDGKYAKGIKVTDAEYGKLNLKRADFHGDWNYTLFPSSSST